MEANTNNKKNKGGRKPKIDPSKNRYVFRLTDEENAKFISWFNSSGMDNKAGFIVSLLFQREIKTIKIDKAGIDYYIRLTNFYSQFQSVGTNYNQVVKILYRNFSEKKAASYLFKLEKLTVELASLCKKIIELTAEFEEKYMIKELKK